MARLWGGFLINDWGSVIVISMGLFFIVIYLLYHKEDKE